MCIISELTTTQQICIASVGSTIEALTQHPLNILKNSKQYNIKVQWNPTFLYKGLTIGTSTASFLTAIQYLSYGRIHNSLSGKLSERNNSFVSSALCGFGMTFFVTPIEMGIIQQCKYYNSTTRNIIKTNITQNGYKFLYRGFMGTAVRETMYGFGLLSLTPYLENKFNDFGLKRCDSVCAAITSGILLTGISHPFDTIKTVQQYNMYQKIEYRKYLTINNLYKGVGFRMLRNSCAFLILNQVNKMAVDYLHRQ